MTEKTRAMSHWAWGWEDRFPSRDGRENLGKMVEAMLGVTPGELEEPCPESEIKLSPSRAPKVPDSLQQLVDTSEAARIRQTYGRAYPDIVRGFRGDFIGAPDLVVRPTDAREVAQILDWASDARVAVIPRGGGTSVVGGVNTREVTGEWQAVASLDLTQMASVLEIDEANQAAHIQAGALGPQLEAQLRQHDLTLRHFPQSFEFSTLGGWLATRAGGHFATVYTHIDDLLESMRVVTPRGFVETRRIPCSGAGPEPDRFFLGSEGALGVITDAWMKVRRRPRWLAKADVFFDDFEDVVRATRDISQSGLHPTNCRVLDSREAMLNQVTMDGSNVLLLGFESAHHEVIWPLERALEIALRHGGRCPDGPRQTDRELEKKKQGGAAKQWKDAFFDGPYLQSTLISMGLLADTFETCCLWSEFGDLHDAIIKGMRAAMKEVCGKAGLISCRFTHVYPDGPAPYYTYIAPVKQGSEIAQWTELKAAASEILVKHTAAITHHHSIGRTHLPYWIQKERPELFGAILSAAKKELDPAGVLNPGVLIP